MGLFDWLRSSDNPDATEALLKHLAEQATQLEGKQHRLAARRDSVTLMVSLHGTLAYLVYLVLLYFGVLPGYIPHWAVLVFWPALILGLRQVVSKLFDHRLRSVSHQLEAVKKRQNTEIEKLKKQTRYDETRALLERLESPKPQPQPQSAKGGKTPRKSMPATLSTPQGTPVRSGAQPGPAAYLGTPVADSSSGSRPPAEVMSPSASARRGWADRFADVLLGENEGGGSGTGAQNRYALICGKCLNHNGLVLKEELPYTQYNCPKCGHFNPPKNLSASSRPSNMLEVPSQLKSRQPPKGRASMPSSMSVPAFGTLASAAGDSDEEEDPEIKLAGKSSGEPLAKPGLRRRPTGSSLADDARRQAALAEVDSEEEHEGTEEAYHDT